MKQKVIIIISVVVSVALGVGSIFLLRSPTKPPAKTSVGTISKQSVPLAETSISPNKSETQTKPQYSIDDPSSIWMVVNKQRTLPSTYAPSDLVTVGGGQKMRQEAATAAKELVSAAIKDGVTLKYISGYRSYNYQQSVYSGYVKQSGQASADTFSARPGHSEHQTGLAVDLGNSNGSCDLDACFGTTTGGKWLASNANKFGFIIRYPEGKTGLTGYQYEPWHIRYLGTDLATKVQTSGKTLEQYFGLPAAPDYN